MSAKNEQSEPWLNILAKAIAKNWLAMIFVITITIVFRMPHLSDLTVVIIQNEYDVILMIFFYSTIMVMAVLISYGRIIEMNFKFKNTSYKNDDLQKELFKNSHNKKPKRFGKILQNLNPKDTKETTLRGTNRLDSLLLPPTEETPSDFVHRIYPKFLATYMILSIAFSVENTYYELFLTSILYKNSFLFITILLVALTHPKLTNFIKKILRWNYQHNWFPVVVIGVAFVLILFFGIKNKGGTEEDIRHLFYSLTCLAVIYFTFSVSYNPAILKLKQKIVIPFIYILILGSLTLYIILFIKPNTDFVKSFTPIIILMVCLIGIYTLFTLLSAIGRNLKLPILTLIFIGSIILTIITAKNENFKHYEVTSVPSKISPDDRMDMEDYIKYWIESRMTDIENSTTDKPFPIILVSAEGGGSRAGHWAFLVHSYLYKKDPNYFNKYLFSITGASGGSVGSNIFYSHAFENWAKPSKDLFTLKEPIYFDNDSIIKLKYKASKFYQKDYISSSIAGLLGRDLVASILNISGFPDRGRITEQEWENSAQNLFNNSNILNRPYLDIMPSKKDSITPPIMVTTTTHVQSGRLFIMSPIKFEPNNNNERQFQDLLSQYNKHYEDRMVSRSSAMLLTARFPYLSPNGRITCIGQFGDGGYYDNMGGIVTRRLEQGLNECLENLPALKNKYEIRHLLITNSSSNCFNDCNKITCEEDKVNYYSQLLTPGKMILRSTFAPPDEFIDDYPPKYRVESERTLIQIVKDTNGKEKCDYMIRPLIPLGRYMSLDAVYSLEKRLESPTISSKLDSLLNYY